MQSLLRVASSLTKVKTKKENTVLTVNFKLCYEHIWRAGLLHKALKKINQWKDVAVHKELPLGPHILH